MIIMGVSKRQKFGKETRGICRQLLLYICPCLDDEADNDRSKHCSIYITSIALKIECSRKNSGKLESHNEIT